MKKSILTIGLFSLVMVLTSFTNSEIISVPKVDNNTYIGIDGNQSAGGNKKVDIDGNQSAGGNKKVDIDGNQSAGGNKKVD